MLSHPQREHGWMVYPARGWRKFMFKLPIYFWRFSLARLNPPNYLLLSTWGKRTGAPRRTMLEYTYLDGCMYLMSGWGTRSNWYHNLTANPCVTAQTRHHGLVRGRVVRVNDPLEIARLYAVSKGKSPVWKDYLELWDIQDNVDDFVNKRERLIIWRIDPTDEKTPPPLGADWAWVWLVVALVVLAIIGFILH